MSVIWGSAKSDTILSGHQNDSIYGGGGHDTLSGGGGEDFIFARGQGGKLVGLGGDDAIIAVKHGYGQFHIYGGAGDDHIKMSVKNRMDWGYQGHHVYGDPGRDTFEFYDLDAIKAPLLIRIDDYHHLIDSIVIDGHIVDLENPPDGMKVVEYNSQQWLVVSEKLMIGLEGARRVSANTDETHFTPMPKHLETLPSVAYVDPKNYVPAGLMPKSGSIYVGNGHGFEEVDHDHASTHDIIHGSTQSEYISASTENSIIHSMRGDDTINAGSGYDTIYGGRGDDRIAGGVDRDAVFGGLGRDFLFGGGEEDWLFGGSGDDRLLGGPDDDVLAGGAGSDMLLGGSGRDKVKAGPGVDTLWGGADSDIFVFARDDVSVFHHTGSDHQDQLSELDIVRDFKVGEDKISFAGYDNELSIARLKIWKADFDEEGIYIISLTGTRQRLLVQCDEEWKDFALSTNFIF